MKQRTHTMSLKEQATEEQAQCQLLHATTELSDVELRHATDHKRDQDEVSLAGSKDKDEAMQELVRTAEEAAAVAQRRLNEKLAARLMLLAGTSGDASMDGASLRPPTPCFQQFERCYSSDGTVQCLRGHRRSAWASRRCGRGGLRARASGRARSGGGRGSQVPRSAVAVPRGAAGAQSWPACLSPDM